MATTRTTNSFQATVPQLADSANIETAFNSYHDSIASTTTGAAVLNRANTFTANQTTNSSLILQDSGNTQRGKLLGTSLATGLFFQAGQTSSDTGATITINRTDTTSTNIASFNIYANNTTLFGGALNLAAGTTSIAPLKFTSGTNLTTATAGVMEYNGLYFLTNNTTQGRGVVTPKHAYSLSSSRTLSTTTATQSIFGVSLALEANTIYEFDVWFSLTFICSFSGSNSTISLSVALPTNATGTYDSRFSTGTASTSPSNYYATNLAQPLTTSTLTYSGTSVTLTGQYKMSGVIRTAASTGNFTPNISLSNSTNAPSSLSINSGAYVTVRKIGAANATLSTGAWA